MVSHHSPRVWPLINVTHRRSPVRVVRHPAQRSVDPRPRRGRSDPATRWRHAQERRRPILRCARRQRRKPGTTPPAVRLNPRMPCRTRRPPPLEAGLACAALLQLARLGGPVGDHERRQMGRPVRLVALALHYQAPPSVDRSACSCASVLGPRPGPAGCEPCRWPRPYRERQRPNQRLQRLTVRPRLASNGLGTGCLREPRTVEASASSDSTRPTSSRVRQAASSRASSPGSRANWPVTSRLNFAP